MGMSPRLLRPRTAAAAAPSGPSDPYFSSVSLLLHMEGANGSSSFTDSSNNGFPVTAESGATITNSESKFGGSSLVSAPGWIHVPADTALDLGSGDWTIECWYYHTGGGYALMAQWGSGGNAWFLEPGILYLNGGGVLSWTPGGLNEWHHLAVARSGDNITAWLDGDSVATNTFSGSVNSSSSYVGIGRDEQGNPGLEGYIDDVRVTVGVARYTSNFTPPDAPFPDQ